jgi:diadenosine tetraphosphate (Ap4A) HIT family hydrolase
MRERILDEEQDVLGFNVGINAGAVAGQTVMHSHMHLIPRRRNDVTDPRGGVRGVIPGMQSY